jgi:vacuolar-type H+-ATPase subunit D/Vma8
MSEEQRDIIESLIVKAEIAIDKADKAQGLFNKLIWAFAVSVFVSVSTVSGLVWQSVHQVRDIEYVRENAYNRTGAMDMQEANQAMIKAVTGLIENEDTKKVVEGFYNETSIILNRINATQSEIVPRSASEAGNGGSQ